MKQKSILVCPSGASACSRLDHLCELGGTCAKEGKKPFRGDFETVDDSVNHPKHYNSHPSGVECIEITEHFGFNLGNVIKYLWRAEEKGAPIEDLKKARWYLDREIKKREGTA